MNKVIASDCGRDRRTRRSTATASPCASKDRFHVRQGRRFRLLAKLL